MSDIIKIIPGKPSDLDNVVIEQRIYYGKQELYNADPKCNHNIVDGDNYSGIKCSKCPGWFCY